MDNCIYLKNENQNKSYKSQEHIIPAGLGGIKKLPKGYVSDEINARFSNIERDGLRNSFLTGNRLRNGPGKRGNQRLEKEKSIKIRILNNESYYGGGLFLGFLFNGNSHIINQVKIEFDKDFKFGQSTYIRSDEESSNHFEEFNLFKRELFTVLLSSNSKFEFIKSDFDSGQNIVLMGKYKDKFYISSNILLINYEYVSSFLISEALDNIELKRFKNPVFSEFTDLKYRFRQKIDINADVFAFMFVKTAFNALAFLMGQEFALNDYFDELRTDIANCSDLRKYIYSSDEVDRYVRPIITEVNDKSHGIYIVGVNNKIYSYVSLYNEWFAHLILVPEYNGSEFSAGFICDWLNKTESHFKNDNFA